MAIKKETPAKKPPAAPQQATRKSETLQNQGATSKAPTSRRVRSAEEIAQRAYEFWQNRGGQHGSDQDDWLRAERELTTENNGGSRGQH